MSIKSKCISRWGLDETSGTDAIDSRGDNDGTSNGAGINETGKVDKAYSFLTSNSAYVNIPYTTSLIPNTFTIAFWINIDYETSEMSVIRGAGGNGHNSGWSIRHSYRRVSFRWGDGTDYQDKIEYQFPTANNWHFVVITFDGSNMKLYTDTVLRDSASSVTFDYANTNDMILGYTNGASYFTGYLDEVSLFDGVLSEGEVLQLYNGGEGLAFEDWDKICYINNAENYETASTSNICGVPDGTEENDLMLAVVNLNTSGKTINTPTGWTKIFEYDAANVTAIVAVFRKYASGSEPSNYTFDGWTSDRSRVTITTYRNAHQSSPIDTYNNESAISANPLTASSINIADDNSMLLFLAYLDTTGQRDGTVPTGMTGRIIDSTGQVNLWFDERVDSGATGTRTSTLNSTTGKMFTMLSLKLEVTAHTLTAVAGSFTLMGVATDLVVGRKMSAAISAFTLTGIATTLTVKRNYALPATVAGYTVTGVNTLFTRVIKIPAATQSYVVTGVGIIATVSRAISATVSSYALTGINTDFAVQRNYTLQSIVSAYTITGVAVDFVVKRNYTIESTVATYAVTGVIVDFTIQRHYAFVANTSACVLVGVAVGLSRGQTLQAVKQTYSLVGFDVSLTEQGDYTIPATTQGYTLTANSANFNVAFTLSCTLRTYTLTANTTGLLVQRNYVLEAQVTSYAISGVVVTFLRAYVVACVLVEYTVTGVETALKRGIGVSVTTANYSLVTPDQALTRQLAIQAVTQTYDCVGVAVDLRYYSGTIICDTAAFTAVGIDVALSRSVIGEIISLNSEFTSSVSLNSEFTSSVSLTSNLL